MWVGVTKGTGSQDEDYLSSYLHVGLKIVFASTAEGTQGTLVAFQACVDDHVSLPVALAFDDQSTHRTLEWFATILRRALRGQQVIVSISQTTFKEFQKRAFSLLCSVLLKFSPLLL